MSRLGDAVRYAKLFIGRSDRASEIYDLLSTHNNLGEKSLYLNLGYWDGAATYDAACQRLAEVLGERAGLEAAQAVLDCGFGFGDQDLYWLRRFAPATIDGLNITESQVRAARKRVAEAGLDKRIRLHAGSATRMPFADGTFDRVLALETAFHYDTREVFFREALRVLKKGGRIATADIIPAQTGSGVLDRIGDRLGRSFWQIPDGNMYSKEEYGRRLEGAGFTNVRLESIAARVYRPFAEFAKTRLSDPEVRARMDPFVRWSFKVSLDPMADLGLDYIIAVAEKP